MESKQKEYNKQNPISRIERAVYDDVVAFCNENDLVISRFISNAVRYVLDHVEVKTVDVPVERLFIGDEEV
ncbi:hypothetical protein K6V33_07460 [Streptococcus suis]|nr:hypothetical protein [Streptococcus suis]